jgi:dipeptidyl aminopeptidase/acylaminoacyl peptidase
LRTLEFDSNKAQIQEELPAGSNYKRYIAQYESMGNTIYGLLTVPNEDPPEGGFPAIVFNHGYIPPQQYRTTERYVAYVDNLARNGFVVFKIDMRGHGDSEGTPNGSYFSNGYAVDAINALKSLQKLDNVNPDRIGMWGHSMAGNLIMRAMLVTDEIKAGVIWSGAVYSYEDFGKYGLSDSSYVRRELTEDERKRRYDDSSVVMEEVRKLREDPENVDFSSEFWTNISLTANIDYLDAPVQLHHALNDEVVNVGYMRDMATVLEENEKVYETYEYEGGGHNIESPYFEQAMQRTVEFFEENL